MTYSVATESDIDEIALYYARSQKEQSGNMDDVFINNLRKESRNYLLKVFEDNCQVTYIARDEMNINRLVSFATVYFFSTLPSIDNHSGKIAFMKSLYIDPAYKSNDVSCEICRKLLSECRTRGYNYVLVGAKEEERRFYRDCGFHEDDGMMILNMNNDVL